MRKLYVENQNYLLNSYMETHYSVLDKKWGHTYEIETTYQPKKNALFMLTDAIDPPFKQESFDFIVSLNMLDNVNLPLVLIGQMDALLKPGGKLLITCPYEWREDICDPKEWLVTDEIDSPEAVRQILEGAVFPEMELNYEILEEHHNIPWPLRNHDRYWSLFLTHILLARKKIQS